MLRIAVLLMLSLTLIAAKKKTFVYCSEGSPSTFNPQIAMDGTTFNASSKTVYNRLVEFKRGSTDILPALATSWEYDNKSMIWTFNLRRGVKWHSSKRFSPTREFNADDVLFSLNRMRLKTHPYHKVSGGRYEYFEAMEMSKLIKDIVKINDYKIKISLTKNFSPFLANLAMDFASILSKEYGDKMLKAGTPEMVDTHPIGTGVFVFQKYAKDSMIRFTANKNYFGNKTPLDELVFSITVDKNVRIQKLKTGECHLVAYPAVQSLDEIKKNKNLVVLEQEGSNVAYLGMNTKVKPFDNLLVRRAINHALNRKSYLSTVYKNTAVLAKNPIPPTLWGYNDKVKDYEYNPDLAKKLLKQAGYPKGFTAELWTLPVQRPYMPDGKKAGVLMQADLAKVGIKVKLVTYDWPTYLSKASAGEHQMLQLGWSGDNGDPDNFLSVLLSCAGVESGANNARWCDKEFDSYIRKASSITNVSKRSALYKKAQLRFKEQAPWVVLAHAKVFRAMSKRVRGYKIDPLGSDRFDGVDLK